MSRIDFNRSEMRKEALRYMKSAVSLHRVAGYGKKRFKMSA
jgi:hypothetical protein